MKKVTLVDPKEVESQSESENEEKWIVSSRLDNERWLGYPQPRSQKDLKVENYEGGHKSNRNCVI